MTQLARHEDLDTLTLGRILAQSGYFQDAKSEAQAIVKVLAGRELGFGAISSMGGVHIINGKPAIGANLMASAIKRSGKYDYRVAQLDATACVIVFLQRGQNGGWAEIGESSFSVQDAETAGALDGRNKHTWKAFLRNMLFARAISNGARWYTPDIFGGPVYTPEELGANVNGEGEVIHGEIVEPPRQIAAPEPDTAPIIADILALQQQIEHHDPSFDAHDRATLERGSFARLDAYHAKLTAHLEALKSTPPDAPDADPSPAEVKFWSAWGGYMGGTTWEHVIRELGVTAIPTTDDEWTALGAAMDAKAHATAQE